jgi:ectoine hydroxylase-related dioxygenase (phytanoyl-CoA dioxygenase family)
MNNYWAFAPMTDSSDVRNDADALRERLDEDGYLYVRGLLDPERVMGVRGEILPILAEHGWIAGGKRLERARATSTPWREGDDEYFEVYDEVQKLESFHSLAHDEGLLSVMQAVLGDSAFPHPLKVARLVFPSNPTVTTPPHQDFLNNQGTPSLTATWIPLGDCPMNKGTLAVLRGSHRCGVLPIEFHMGPGNRQAVVPSEVREELTWVTTDMAAGDVLIFGALTVHASLHNTTRDMRLSIDFRYQPEGDELTDAVLEPHFGRLSWEEIYAGWKSDELQYYWRELDYDLVPFDRAPFEASAPDEKEIMKVLLYDKARRGRREQETTGGSA